MRLNFRQGLVTYQKDVSGQPKYLSMATNSNFVSLLVAPTPLTITFAQGGSDYLATFDQSIDLAWGPLIPGVDNWLYWEMDPITAQVRQGITTVMPVFNSLEPDRIPDQSWFDMSTHKMRVWQAQSQKWVERIRVFAGRAVGGSSRDLVMYAYGSQVNLNTDSTPGYPMLDSQLRPLRTSLGELLTTGTDVRIKNTIGTAGILALPTNAYIPVIAGEAIPAMSLVYFSASDTVSLASSDPALITRRTPVGIIQEALAMNEVGILTQVGDIVYDQWDWSGHIGKAVYTDSSGRLTTVRPQGLLVFRVGFIKNKNTIIFGIDAETEPQVYQAAPSQLIVNGLSPIITQDSINPIGERVVSVSIQPAVAGYQDGFMSAAQAQSIQNVANQMATVSQQILSLDANKADKIHTHTIAQVDGLQAALDSKFPITGNFDDRYSLLTHNHDGRYAFLLHTHPISEIDGLTSRLATKLERATGILPFTRVFQTVDQSGPTDIGQGNDLNQALAGKANVIHTHEIDQVGGLQSALDDKANRVHVHDIDQVEGLQAALNDKANVIHTHNIDQIDGLQSALDDKSDIGHTHTREDIENLDSELSALYNLIETKTLQSLDDVDLTALQQDQSLIWNGSKWQNLTPKFGVKIYSGVSTSYFTNGITIQSLDGSVTVISSNRQDGDDNVTTLDLSASLRNLTDVRIIAPQLETNHILTWDGEHWTNKPLNVTNLGLDGLTNVEINAPTQTSYLGFNTATAKWVNRQINVDEIAGLDVSTPSEGSTFIYDGEKFIARDLNLNDISDVDAPSPEMGQVLTFNGLRWTSADPATSITTFAGLDDVSISNVANNQMLSWNGTHWINVNASSITGLSLGQLDDVSTGTQQIGETLIWDGATWHPGVLPTGLPSGGQTNQILSKASNASGDVAWVNAPVGIPASGTTGDMLVKASSDDGDVIWAKPTKPTDVWYVAISHADAMAKISSGELTSGMWVDILNDETHNGFQTLNNVIGSTVNFIQYAEIAAYIGTAPAEIPTNNMLGRIAFMNDIGMLKVYNHRPISQPGDMWTESDSPGLTRQFYHDYDGVIKQLDIVNWSPIV